MYIYIYMYVCMYIYIYMYVCMCVCVMYVYKYISVCVFTFVCVCAMYYYTCVCLYCIETGLECHGKLMAGTQNPPFGLSNAMRDGGMILDLNVSSGWLETMWKPRAHWNLPSCVLLLKCSIPDDKMKVLAMTQYNHAFCHYLRFPTKTYEHIWKHVKTYYMKTHAALLGWND